MPVGIQVGRVRRTVKQSVIDSHGRSNEKNTFYQNLQEITKAIPTGFDSVLFLARLYFLILIPSLI